MSKVAIVILNWNGRHFLEKYLHILIQNSPLEINGGSVEIIVADNGSTDASVEWLKEKFSSVRLIEFDKNYGFTGGYNKALNQIEAEYFILLNSDIRVDSNWLSPLIDFMDSHPRAGVCQPKVLSEANNDYFEYAGASGGFLDSFGFPYCRGRILSKVEKDQGQYDSALRIFWATGAAMVCRAQIFKDLGGLDESFFAHMEEIDFCWRAQLVGWEVWAIPQSRIFHVGGGTLPNNSPKKLYLNYRNNLLMLYKNYPAKNKAKLIFARKCIDGLSAIVYMLQGKFSFVKSVFKAHHDFDKMKKHVIVSHASNNSKVIKLSPTFIILNFFVGKNMFSKLN